MLKEIWHRWITFDDYVTPISDEIKRDCSTRFFSRIHPQSHIFGCASCGVEEFSPPNKPPAAYSLLHDSRSRIFMADLEQQQRYEAVDPAFRGVLGMTEIPGTGVDRTLFCLHNNYVNDVHRRNIATNEYEVVDYEFFLCRNCEPLYKQRSPGTSYI
jgi:hypothetical protein